ncbi:unnamed protein product [Sphagnum jensenii]|uniref:1-acylglycerol-3-phosphate O-acyltransferase n=1 Tax=Sphagnum jensenii TaxID=128206 RepID=A0ABP1ARM8_9BRYO
MEGGFTFVALPLGLMFFLSGLIINVFQLLATLFVLPLSRHLFRIANMVMMEALWSELIWLVDWWAGVQVRVYADLSTWNHMGKEHALLISNHRSDIDWLVGWIMAQRCGCLGGTRAIMKQSTKFLPVIGWSMWFSDYVFLARNWARDEHTLKTGFQRLEGFPRVLWVALFVEGTRFTKAKLTGAQEFARSHGMRVPRHVLVPRTKGFVSAVQNMRNFVPAVYDATVAISKDLPAPTMLRLIRGQPSVVHVHVRRTSMTELPTSDEELASWCHKAFATKDALLDEHEKENTFGENLYRPIPRPLLPLFIVIGWALLLLPASWWLLRPLLASSHGIAWIVGILLLVVICIQVLVMSSQSERSSNPAARKSKPVNEAPLPPRGKAG